MGTNSSVSRLSSSVEGSTNSKWLTSASARQVSSSDAKFRSTMARCCARLSRFWRRRTCSSWAGVSLPCSTSRSPTSRCAGAGVRGHWIGTSTACFMFKVSTLVCTAVLVSVRVFSGRVHHEQIGHHHAAHRNADQFFAQPQERVSWSVAGAVETLVGQFDFPRRGRRRRRGRGRRGFDAAERNTSS